MTVFFGYKKIAFFRENRCSVVPQTPMAMTKNGEFVDSKIIVVGIEFYKGSLASSPNNYFRYNNHKVCIHTLIVPMNYTDMQIIDECSKAYENQFGEYAHYQDNKDLKYQIETTLLNVKSNQIGCLQIAYNF